jgi:hypothetical protein
MEYLRRSPQGSVLTWENVMRGVIQMTAMAVILGIHVRVGNEDNLWRVKGERFTTVQQIVQMVRLCEAYGRKVTTAREARESMKIGVWYDSPEETLQRLVCRRTARRAKRLLTWETTGRKASATRLPTRTRWRIASLASTTRPRKWPPGIAALGPAMRSTCAHAVALPSPRKPLRSRGLMSYRGSAATGDADPAG